MTSLRKARRRALRWERYIERTSRSSIHHHDYPFGLTIKTTPGNFAPRRIMRHRGAAWYATNRMLEELGETTFSDCPHGHADQDATANGSNPGGGA